MPARAAPSARRPSRRRPDHGATQMIHTVTLATGISEITSLRWLGVALSEAIFFYGLVAGLLALVL
jgi:hypothetical protein